MEIASRVPEAGITQDLTIMVRWKLSTLLRFVYGGNDGM